MDDQKLRPLDIKIDGVGEAEARFMLIACSAFLNFAKAKGAWPSRQPSETGRGK